MLYVDVHCHLDHHLLVNKVDEVVKKAWDNGVRKLITNGLNHQSNLKTIQLSKKFPSVYGALGIYPPDTFLSELKEIYRENKNEDIKRQIHEQEKLDIDKEIDFIQKSFKTNKKLLAIGEVGLDHSLPETDKKYQKQVFERFIRLSEKTKKPLIIHSRKAETDVIDMIESSTLKNPIFHCFSGKKKQVKKIQENAWCCSIPTNIVRSQQFQIMAEILPLSQILTETDAPFLSPFKERYNEPAFIPETVKKIADIKKITEEEISNHIYMNYQRILE